MPPIAGQSFVDCYTAIRFPPPTLRPIGRLESATLRLETGDKTFQTLLTIEQIAQTIGFGTLD